MTGGMRGGRRTRLRVLDVVHNTKSPLLWCCRSGGQDTADGGGKKRERSLLSLRRYHPPKRHGMNSMELDQITAAWQALNNLKPSLGDFQ